MITCLIRKWNQKLLAKNEIQKNYQMAYFLSTSAGTWSVAITIGIGVTRIITLIPIRYISISRAKFFGTLNSSIFTYACIAIIRKTVPILINFSIVTTLFGNRVRLTSWFTVSPISLTS